MEILVKLIGLFSIFVWHVHCHGTMVLPHNLFDCKQWLNTSNGEVFDYIGMKSGLQCKAGCLFDPNQICPREKGDCRMHHPGCSCFWFKNYTHIAEPTIFKENYLTYLHVEYPDLLKNNPWRAPGRAFVDSPCGSAGGNIYGCLNGDCDRSAGGYGYGISSLSFHFPHDFYVTKWKRGSIVEVTWAIAANHGGGYSYRLCKVPVEGFTAITEELCQKIPLTFVGDIQWVQFGEDNTTRFSIPAVRVSEGTFPPGSQWTRNPIPACRGQHGGAHNPTRDCYQGFQFPPPAPGLSGFGTDITDNYKFEFSIIDKVKIPSHISPGEYILSFRWDCEQTPQVWNSCASIYLQ